MENKKRLRKAFGAMGRKERREEISHSLSLKERREEEGMLEEEEKGIQSLAIFRK